MPSELIKIQEQLNRVELPPRFSKSFVALDHYPHTLFDLSVL